MTWQHWIPNQTRTCLCDPLGRNSCLYLSRLPVALPDGRGNVRSPPYLCVVIVIHPDIL